MGVKGDASPLRVEGRALVAVRRNIRTKCGYSVRRRAVTPRVSAVKRQKGAKGVWGKTRVFPHMLHIIFVEPVLRNSPVDCFGSICAASPKRAVSLKVHDVLINQSA